MTAKTVAYGSPAMKYTGMFRRIKNDKRGFYTLEAAIFLPIFIIALLTVAYVIRVQTVDENVSHAMYDEGRKLAANAYILPVAPLFPYELENRIAEENKGDIDDENVTAFLYRYSAKGIDDLIYVENTYTAHVRLPLAFTDAFDRESRLLFRAFTGKKSANDPKPYAEMERDEASETVWIFPRAGERYHKENCPVIKVDARQRLLNSSVRFSYSPCELCKPDDLSNGATVYCFPAAGRAYHRGTCTLVDRYVVEIEKSEAIERGYTPCMRCGG